MVDRLSYIHSQYSKCKIGLCELREQERTKGRTERCEKMEERWRKDALHARMEGVDWRCTAKSRCIARSRSSRCFFFLSRATVGQSIDLRDIKLIRSGSSILPSLLFCPDFPLGWPIGKLNIGAQTAAAIRTSLRDDRFDARISVSRLSFPFDLEKEEALLWIIRCFVWYIGGISYSPSFVAFASFTESQCMEFLSWFQEYATLIFIFILRVSSVFFTCFSFVFNTLNMLI